MEKQKGFADGLAWAASVRVFQRAAQGSCFGRAATKARSLAGLAGRGEASCWAVTVSNLEYSYLTRMSVVD